MITFNHIEQALKMRDFDGFTAQMGMSPSGRERMQPNPQKPPRQSAVLILIYPIIGDGLHLILTKRTEHLSGHSGQISFPGGRVDDDDQSFEQTALREACEEIGTCEQSRIHLVGRLTKMWIPPSNYNVVPIVATMQSEPQIIPNPAEVAQVIPMSLDTLVDEKTKKITQMNFQNTVFDVPYYDVQGHIVWGATAGMLSELETRLKFVLQK